ncbi:MAG: SapC family protein [Desulfovibrio sp.]|nr:SapC family protein [Desulfovibrio sp.]
MPTSNIVPLSKKKHASLTYAPLANYAFTADRNSIPLLPFEVSAASRFFPVIFPDSRNAVPHALLGLGDVNIFVDDEGNWKAPYLPLMVSNYPFSLIQAHFKDDSDSDSDARKSELAIGIEENAPHFHQPDGLPLFGKDGESTETLKRIENALLAQYKRQEAMTQALAELTLHGTLKERVVTVLFDGLEKNVGGLRCADQEKVMSLPEATLGHWVKNGLMEMLYAHWQSLRNLRLLLEDASCPSAGERKETIQ